MTLLPCPFCSGQAEIVRAGTRRQSTIIACSDCGCRLESPDEGDQYGDSWNHRAAHEPLAALDQRNATLKQEIATDLYSRAAAVIRGYADFGGDDHSVGVCNCSDIRLAEELEAAEAASALPPCVGCERMRKLFYLAAHDVIFFSTYDQKTDTWPAIGEYWSPCVNLGDTFAYACADGERLDDSEIDRLICAHNEWGYDGVVAWASLIRKCEPIEPRRTPAYHEARSALTKGAGQS